MRAWFTRIWSSTALKAASPVLVNSSIALSRSSDSCSLASRFGSSPPTCGMSSRLLIEVGVEPPATAPAWAPVAAAAMPATCGVGLPSVQAAVITAASADA